MAHAARTAHTETCSADSIPCGFTHRREGDANGQQVGDDTELDQVFEGIDAP